MSNEKFTQREVKQVIQAEKVQKVVHPTNLTIEKVPLDVPQKEGPKVGERMPVRKPKDNLHPEGEFDRPQKSEFKPGDRPTRIIHEDNLHPEGEFYTPEKPEYQPGERVPIKRTPDNLTVSKVKSKH